MGELWVGDTQGGGSRSVAVVCLNSGVRYRDLRPGAGSQIVILLTHWSEHCRWLSSSGFPIWYLTYFSILFLH